MRRYTVILHPAEESGYWVEVPALPGCYSQGESVEEAVAKAREAIETHLEALSQDGQGIPDDQDLVRPLRAREIVRKLEAAGYRLRRQVGSHGLHKQAGSRRGWKT
jgi:predicted RNase H-like HicB family nuclease